jgi:hypothetical protein
VLFQATLLPDGPDSMTCFDGASRADKTEQVCGLRAAALNFTDHL